MSIKMKKSDLVITASIMALMLAAVLAGLAACQPFSDKIELPAVIPTTGTGTGDMPVGDHGLPATPRIEIYWDDIKNVNQAGKELTWSSESFRKIAGKVLNAPAGFDYLEWTISPPTAVTDGIVSRLPLGFANRGTIAVPSYRTLPMPMVNGFSEFELDAGAVPGTAHISVRNTKQDGTYGQLTAYFDIRVGSGPQLPALTVYVTETITVSNIGVVKSDTRSSTSNPAPLLEWSVRGGNAGISAVDGSYISGGYPNASLTLTGLWAGNTTYYAKSRVDGVMVDTEGPLEVIASTTWYVGPGAVGKYGFRESDKITWETCLINMRAYYSNTVSKWPRKGETGWFGEAQQRFSDPIPPEVWRDNEQHGVIRLTGNETGGLPFAGGYYPVSIDLVNDSPQTGQRNLGGSVRVGLNKILTMTGIKTTGNMEIESGAQLTMLPPYQTEINGPLIVVGLLTMQDGSLSSALTRVWNGGRLTIKAGEVRGGTVRLEKGTLLTMDGGTFTNILTEVQKDAVFTMNNGTLRAMHTYEDGTSVETKTDVQAGGTLTVNAGSVDGYVEVSGKFTMNGGIFNSQKVDVKTGGWLEIGPGTTIIPGSQVYRNGVALSSPVWPPANLPFVLAP
ncbi:hypothetical protein AGMMS49940_20050 [Spirochaetia bacterium]|nr:hypothetical protein AGMMS49940_20050 [Spirochaetia bacterium]